MADFVRYAVDPLEPFPKRWFDHLGNVTVMAGPVNGYLMVRRPGAFPFVLSVAQILNADRCVPHGPFTLLEKQKRPKVADSVQLAEDADNGGRP